MNIFYNRENEIKFLEELQSEELNVINNEEKHQEWSKKTKKKFNHYRHELKLERRREKENIPLNSLEKGNCSDYLIHLSFSNLFWDRS
ncbi:Mobile element protein [Methanosarcina mazei Tuc01]|uniref:Mobile element protein n=1 Tax=Methanosarcina mazei Tuc01 TaxID=1236903 RepID=M1Q5F3_METMZ|nr:Mobile element protein [Methanosarcina mazei Tuc01]